VSIKKNLRKKKKRKQGIRKQLIGTRKRKRGVWKGKK